MAISLRALITYSFCCTVLSWTTDVSARDFGIAEQSPYQVTESRTPCDSYHPERRPYFGDTHVHTTYSQDASTQGTQLKPADAYRFAKGQPVGIQPYDSQGIAQRTVALDRPLDFAIVTDHAEQFGEVHICKTPGLAGHDSWVCWLYRSYPRAAFYIMNAMYSVVGDRWGFCGEEGENCAAAAKVVWLDIQKAAEDAYDRTANCDFTTFVGYEWTAGPKTAHLHRNVVFRNAAVPSLPISVMETGPLATELWRQLDAKCRDTKTGCEAITIPHNSNLSKGIAFTSGEVIEGEISKIEAPTRSRYDRLAEVMQHKGDSECALVPGVTDEECSFEKTQRGAPLKLSEPPLQAVDYVRDALKRGLTLESDLGINPLQLGLIASTDTHLGTPGLTTERGHPGHGGAGLSAANGLPPGLPDYLEFNPGGLAVLWAEENSRDALFEAMQRREAYGTSGNRPVLRFFGGWNYAIDVCARPSEVAATGYADGVPMGGLLTNPDLGASSPRFIVAGLRDPDPSAGPLQRIEVVKGWFDGTATHERVYTIAQAQELATVDLDTCERSVGGQGELCEVWADPDFDPGHPAFYYARALETPSCRWSQWACNAAGVDCRESPSVTEGFEPCCAPSHQRIIQERAWSSPIWYRPLELSSDRP